MAAITRYQTRLENTPQREQEFLELSRDYQTTKDYYQSLLKRHQEAQLAEDMEQRRKGEQFRILDAATPSTEPAAPNRLRLVMMGLGLALGLAAGAVALLEQLDSSFHSVEDLRGAFELPVLVSIPPIVIASDTRARRMRTCVATVAVLVGLLALVGASRFPRARVDEHGVRRRPAARARARITRGRVRRPPRARGLRPGQ